MADSTFTPNVVPVQGPLPDTGVYAIVNRVNGKRYVGSAAKSFRSRWNQHRSCLSLGRHPNRYLQAAWNKHGESAFEFVIVERAVPEQCVPREQFYIDLHAAADRRFGYNLSPTAGSPLGVKQSQESVAKRAAANSVSQRGRKHTAESLAKMSAAKKGKPNLALRGHEVSEETRAKIAATLAGRRLSPEAAENHRLAMRRPETLSRLAAAKLGKRQSAETRARRAASMRESWADGKRKGFRHGEESRAKMSASRRGKKQRPETVAKRAAALKGHGCSDEARARISAAHRAKFEATVAEVRRRYKPRDKANGTRALAREFGLDRHTITRMVRGDYYTTAEGGSDA